MAATFRPSSEVFVRHHRVHPDGAMIDSYKQGNKTLPAAEEEGTHLHGGLPRPQRLFASLRRTAIFANHFQARVRFFGLGDISPDATPGARPKNSGAGPNVAANHAPAGINPAASGSVAIGASIIACRLTTTRTKRTGGGKPVPVSTLSLLCISG